MRAVVAYESMYGNTHLVADAIGAGLGTVFDVRVSRCQRPAPRFWTVLIWSWPAARRTLTA
jgi:flavodoxin